MDDMDLEIAQLENENAKLRKRLRLKDLQEENMKLKQQTMDPSDFRQYLLRPKITCAEMHESPPMRSYSTRELDDAAKERFRLKNTGEK